MMVYDKRKISKWGKGRYVFWAWSHSLDVPNSTLGKMSSNPTDFTLSRLSGSGEIARNSLNHIYNQLATEREPSWNKILSHYTLLLDQAKGIWEDDLSLFKLYSPNPHKIPDLPKPNGIPMLLSTAIPPECTDSFPPEEKQRLHQVVDKESIRNHN